MSYFYDFNIKPNINIIKTLEKFKFKGACVFYDVDKYNKNTIKEFEELKDKTSLDLYHGVYINESNPQQLRKQVQRHHRKVDLIMAAGSDTKINRSICETPEIDIINHPYANKKNSGINQVLAKLLVENNITVNINYMDIIRHHGFYRAKILNQINQLLLLQRKFNFRCIISTGSKGFYDVRSARSMIRMSKLMGMDVKYAKECMSTNVEQVIENIDIHKRSIVQGVELIQ